jgi:hypothetical protein
MTRGKLRSREEIIKIVENFNYKLLNVYVGKKYAKIVFIQILDDFFFGEIENA